MSTIARTSLVRGPAVCQYTSPADQTTQVSFSVKEDFEIKDSLETLIINTSAAAHADERAIEALSEASIVPAGIWKNAVIAAIYTPFATYRRGASLLTATDLPFIANAVDGEIHTIVAAAITKIPDLYLSAKKTMIGSMSFSGYRAKGKGWNDASSLRTVASGGTGVDANFTPAGIIVQPYSATWGAVAGFTSFDTQDGWTIRFNLKAEPISVDSAGRIDIAFDEISVMASCMPVGPTSANILAAQKFQGLSLPDGRGASLQNDGSGGVTPDLVISGVNDAGATSVTVGAAQLKTSGYKFGAHTLRVGEVGWVATRKFTAGVPQALFSMTAAS